MKARYVPPALALAASLWGFYIVARVLARGADYPNELRDPVILALLPLPFGISAWFGKRVLSAIFYMVYVMASIISGFGFGGPHLTVGVPFLTVGLFVLFARSKQRTAGQRAAG